MKGGRWSPHLIPSMLSIQRSVRELNPVSVIQDVKRISETQNIQEWKVGISKLTGINATKPNSNEERKSSKSATCFGETLSRWYACLFVLLYLVIIRINNGARELFKFAWLATLHQKEYNVLYPVPGTCILPVNEDWLSTGG
jgi:hypothetical protein